MRSFPTGSRENAALVLFMSERFCFGQQLRWAPVHGQNVEQTLILLLPCWFQQGGESDGFSHTESQPQRLPQPPDMRQQPARKVTLTKGGPQQPQHLPVGPHMYPAISPGIKSIQGIHPAKKVLNWKGPASYKFPGHWLKEVGVRWFFWHLLMFTVVNEPLFS